MTDITIYKPSRDPNARDYPDKIDNLIDILQGYVTEIEQARNGYGTLKIGTVSYAGATADIPLSGFRINGAATTPVTSSELTSKSYVDSTSAAAAAPCGLRAGDTYSGTHNYVGATLRAATKAPGSSGTEVATVDYANALAFSATLPAQTGNSGKLLTTNGTSASWVDRFPFSGRSPRTSNAMLAAADGGKLIDITSGTFTQTLTAAATLGSNWYCHIRNSGTGDITLDPNAAELIDGMASYVMYPGETRLVMCDGTAFYTIVLTSFYRVFTSTATFYCPPGYNRMQGLIWGGGGGGNGGYGGNGGSCVEFDLRASDFAASQTFTVGAGGAAGADGGASIVLTITSGTAGKGNTFGSYGYGRDYVSGPIAPNRIGGAYPYANAIYGDYGGGLGLNTAGSPASVGHSIFGGGGGVTSGSGGSSIFAGTGGVGAGSGVAPAGGGGSTGAGARGEIRIWGII